MFNFRRCVVTFALLGCAALAHASEITYTDTVVSVNWWKKVSVIIRHDDVPYAAFFSSFISS